jgi:hypothetical protein
LIFNDGGFLLLRATVVTTKKPTVDGGMPLHSGGAKPWQYRRIGSCGVAGRGGRDDKEFFSAPDEREAKLSYHANLGE